MFDAAMEIALAMSAVPLAQYARDVAAITDKTYGDELFASARSNASRWSAHKVDDDCLFPFCATEPAVAKMMAIWIASAKTVVCNRIMVLGGVVELPNQDCTLVATMRLSVKSSGRSEAEVFTEGAGGEKTESRTDTLET